MDLLGSYSKHGDDGKSTIALIEQAARCRAEGSERQTPSENQTPPRPRLKALTSSELDTLIAAYKTGESTYALAKRFGTRRETVAGHLERQGIARRGKPRVELDIATRQMIIGLGVCGTPVSTIAKKFGCTDRVVAKVLDSAGIARRTINRARRGS